MTQIFGPNSNWIIRSVIVLVFGLAVLSFAVAEVIDRSPYVTRQGEFVDQPIAFSHQHHVGEIGIDCRYCHVNVERGAVASLPTAAVCMSCHNQIWAKSPILEPVRKSVATSQPIKWRKVTNLPDYVYFDHSVHIAKGVSCIGCHGHVENMPLTYLAHPMQMEFCLNCHRDPEKHLQSRSEVFFFGDPVYASQPEQAAKLMMQYHVERKVDCTTCHR